MVVNATSTRKVVFGKTLQEVDVNMAFATAKNYFLLLKAYFDITESEQLICLRNSAL